MYYCISNSLIKIRLIRNRNVHAVSNLISYIFIVRKEKENESTYFTHTVTWSQCLYMPITAPYKLSPKKGFEKIKYG